MYDLNVISGHSQLYRVYTTVCENLQEAPITIWKHWGVILICEHGSLTAEELTVFQWFIKSLRSAPSAPPAASTCPANPTFLPGFCSPHWSENVCVNVLIHVTFLKRSQNHMKQRFLEVMMAAVLPAGFSAERHQEFFQRRVTVTCKKFVTFGSANLARTFWGCVILAQGREHRITSREC